MALDHFALMRVLLLRLAAALPIAAFIAIAISLLSQRGIQLMPSGMTLVNMALVLLPFLFDNSCVANCRQSAKDLGLI